MHGLRATLVAAAGVVASTTALPPTHCTKYDVNIWLQGYHLASYPNQSFAKCAQLCLDNSQCRAYSWTTQSNGTCWLRSGYGVGSYSYGAKSSVVVRIVNGQCPGGAYFVTTQCDMPGNDVKSVKVSGKGYTECMRLGQATGAIFTWSDYNGGTCWFKSNTALCKFAANTYSGVFTRFTAYQDIRYPSKL